MKALIYDGKRVSLKDVPKPEIKNSQMLIHIKSAGICGTDLAIAKGYLPTPTPIILGHEFSGEIVEVGKDLDSSWIGKRVTCEINSNIDYNCYYCKQKIFTQCVSRKALGIDIDGAFAEYIAVDSFLVHELPISLSYEDATFIEPLAAAYQTFEMMPIEPTDKIVAIFGLGKLGLLITQVSLLRGLSLIVIDGSEKKLNIAKQFGATICINRNDTPDIPSKIKEYTNGLGADIVIDTTGNPEALKDVIASCRTRGKLHIKSTHGLDTPINLTDMVVRELTLYTSRCGPFDKAIEGLKSGSIKVQELISARYKLEEYKDAFSSNEISSDHIKTIFLL